MTGFRTAGADDLDRIAHALKEAGDKDLQKAIGKAFRDEVKPLGQRVLLRGADELPQRGGFADRVRNLGRVGSSNALRGNTTSVRVILRNKGADLSRVNRGLIRHPVFGRDDRARSDWTWVGQPVRPGAFSRAFEEEAGPVREAALKAAQGVLDDVARKA